MEVEELYVTEENCKLFSANDDQNCFQQHSISVRVFWKHAELRSCILERDGRASPLGWWHASGTRHGK